MIAFRHIKNLVKKSLYCSISTVQKDGVPHCSPVGSVFLEDENRGYYLEMFTGAVQRAQSNNSHGCILVVNTSLLFWIKSLFKGYFPTPPAVRLLVKFGEKRPVSEVEEQRFRKRVRPLRMLKGHRLLWSRAEHAREFSIQKVIPVSLGKMTSVSYND